MTLPLLSPAQKRAVEWLPATGEWREYDSDDSDAFQLFWFSCGKRELIEYRLNPLAYRLTPAGIALFHPEIDEGKAK